MMENNSEENGLYMLELSKLKEGDVILESGSSKFSWWIKKGTRSEYSHAMVYVGMSIIHALTDGVYSENPQRILVNKKSDLKVLRLANREETQIKKIVMNARLLVGSLYSISEAIAAPFKKNTIMKARQSRQYCSKLVANVYLDAEVPLVNNPDYCTPEDINNSKILIEVPNCVKKASDEDIEFANSKNPILDNQRSTFAYLSKCRVLFKKVEIEIQTENDVSMALEKYRNMDSEVCQYIKESRYLEHYNADEKNTPARYNIHLFFSMHQNNIYDKKEILEGQSKSLYPIIERHLKNYQASVENHRNRFLEYDLLFIELYRNILLSSKKWLLTLHQFSKLVNENGFTESSSKLLNIIDKTIE